jgi:hypothetical protein
MKNLQISAASMIFFAVIITSIQAQSVSEKDKAQITEALNLWNATAKSSDTDKCLSLFDDTENIMLIGSDKGEIFKGKDEIRGWLTRLFAHAGFSWEMDRIDIDSNGKTAWVFVDGSMIVTWDSGQTRKTPYRFTGIMVKKNNSWKWRLFDGSKPAGE